MSDTNAVPAAPAPGAATAGAAATTAPPVAAPAAAPAPVAPAAPAVAPAQVAAPAQPAASAAAPPAADPMAERVSKLEASVRALLAVEEGLIPDSHKDRLELAPTDPAERLAWLAKAKAKGLFGAPAAPATPALPLAHTRPAVSPAPAAAGAPAPKSTLEMSAAEYAQHKARVARGEVPRA